MHEVNRPIASLAVTAEDCPISSAVPNMAIQTIEAECELQVTAYFLDDRQRGLFD